MGKLDILRREATAKRMDWDEGSHYCNWRRYVGPSVREVWHTLNDEQKTAIAVDAYKQAQDAEYD